MTTRPSDTVTRVGPRLGEMICVKLMELRRPNVVRGHCSGTEEVAASLKGSAGVPNKSYHEPPISPTRRHETSSISIEGAGPPYV